MARPSYTAMSKANLELVFKNGDETVAYANLPRSDSASVPLALAAALADLIGGVLPEVTFVSSENPAKEASFPLVRAGNTADCLGDERRTALLHVGETILKAYAAGVDIIVYGRGDTGLKLEIAVGANGSPASAAELENESVVVQSASPNTPRPSTELLRSEF